MLLFVSVDDVADMVTLLLNVENRVCGNYVMGTAHETARTPKTVLPRVGSVLAVRYVSVSAMCVGMLNSLSFDATTVVVACVCLSECISEKVVCS